MRIALMAAALFAAGPALAGEVTVRMAGSAYAPAMVSAKVGDALTFVNDDWETHAVFVPTKGVAVDLGNQKPNETRTLKLTRAGTFEVECVIHPGMLTKVTVAE